MTRPPRSSGRPTSSRSATAGPGGGPPATTAPRPTSLTSSPTTGATTASSIAVTNEIVLSEGTTTDKGLRFPPNIGGGTGDTAYIRHYVPTGSGEATRLHIANENDADDDIYLQTGLVHTNGNLSVNGTITGGAFSGNGSGLSGIDFAVRSIKEIAVTSIGSTSSSVYSDDFGGSISDKSSAVDTVHEDDEM